MDYREILERMHGGKVYFCDDEQLMREQLACLDKLFDFNATRPIEGEKRAALLKDIFAEAGENCYVEPPLHANWGKHTHVGNNFYSNFNLTLVDDTHIYIGNNVMFGPNVVIATANHPVHPGLRRLTAQYNLPVHIGDNVWLGAGVLVMPGVRIGENSVIGAGSVVTKDIPANCVAFGNPCRVKREISEEDYEYFRKGEKIDETALARLK